MFFVYFLAYLDVERQRENWVYVSQCLSLFLRVFSEIGIGGILECMRFVFWILYKWHTNPNTYSWLNYYTSCKKPHFELVSTFFNFLPRHKTRAFILFSIQMTHHLFYLFKCSDSWDWKGHTFSLTGNHNLNIDWRHLMLSHRNIKYAILHISHLQCIKLSVVSTVSMHIPLLLWCVASNITIILKEAL